MNNYLTPLEQVNVLTSIIYGYYNLKGTEVGYQHPEEFLIHKVIETKRGNTIINGIVYLLLSELLDIPVKAINIPRQFVLAYIKPELADEGNGKAAIDRIEFFIDPMSGQVFTHKDVMNYFNRIAITPWIYISNLPIISGSCNPCWRNSANVSITNPTFTKKPNCSCFPAC